MRHVIAAEWKSRDDDLRFPLRNGIALVQRVTHDAIFDLGVKPILIKSDAGCTALRVAEREDHIGLAVAVGVLQGDERTFGGLFRVASIDVDSTVSRNRQVARLSYSVSKDRRTEAFR